MSAGQATLFRDPEMDRRDSLRLRGEKRMVRCAFGDADIPDYHEIEMEVYPWGLAIREGRWTHPDERDRWVCVHPVTGFRVGPYLTGRKVARLFAYLLRGQPWPSIRRYNDAAGMVDKGLVYAAAAEAEAAFAEPTEAS